MEKQGGKGDGSDIGDYSDNDLNKGSDDVVNIVKSPNHMSNIQLVLPHKINYICFCTMVSVISIVVMVVMLVVISNDDLQNVFQLTKEISRISNKLESLSSKIDSHSSTTDGQRTCEKINTSYLYYAFQEENRRLKDELQKTKFRKEDQNNCFQLTKDISRLSNQLESLSTKNISDSSTTDGKQTCDKINTSYLYYALQAENRRLKDELQETKSRKDSITCADIDNEPNQQGWREEQSRFSCNSVSSANSVYGWIVANRSLSFGSSDNFNIIIKFELLYPEIPDNGKILFECGLTTLADHLKFNNPAIIVRGQRCEKEPGMCLYVIDNVLTKLEGRVFEQMSDYIQGQITLELHKSYFVLMSNQKNIYISNILNLSSRVELWPVFRFYNTHLISISLTILSENEISFNRTTVDPHLFVSEENNTISNCKLWSIRTSFSGWDDDLFIVCNYSNDISGKTMEEQACKSDGSDNGDCSEDDLFKGSDDAVNVVKSPKHKSNTNLILPNKIKYICIGTMVSVIGIVVMVVLSATILVVSTEDKQNGLQLLTAILKISNQLDSLSMKTKSESSTTDGTQACKNINNSYIYHVLREDIRKLGELQKTKSRNDDEKNNLQLTKDISRISNQLESLSTKMNSYSSTTNGSQTCEKNNTNYLFYVLQEENRKLKDELKTTKSRKDLITCADTDNKQNKQEDRKKTIAS
ncbi:Hypothetical predicted protein [Mytilus galloprovincialis]|uniref:Uncharacterized protein n=1 Tax=Mytilus galloprovincialis TaxID=29158 RepID=A0A8B6CVN7_MYTGA|nr:Hypothetical predicted protein [Mytilus galloprovincialis]